MKNVNDFKLTDDVTVLDLRLWMSKKDKASKSKIIKLIHHRFVNRYLKHLKGIDSGFLKMAISCLTIETLESFRQGKKDTKDAGAGRAMFESFFDRERNLFPGFNSISSDFYSNIRCGILHQAETTNAWRILRSELLLDKKKKSINSNKFVRALETAVELYIEELELDDFDSKLWKNAIIKLEDICENCQVKPSKKKSH